MNIQIVYKNIDKSEAIDRYAEEKFSKLDKYFRGDVDARVTLSMEHKTQKVDALIPYNGLYLRAEDKSDDIYKSIDLIEEKIEGQLRKYKSRLQKKRGAESIKSPEFNDSAFAETDTHEGHDQPEIVKTKEITAKPMSEDEAILQMELLGHDFFVFRNLDNETAVLYRRRDGNLGLMITKPE